MAKIFTILTLFISATLIAQDINHSGTYIWKSSTSVEAKDTKTQESQITRILRVNSDGTFSFDRLRPAWGNNKEDNIYGKGTWTSKGKYIYFSTDPEIEIDDKHTLNFTNTKGRWDARKNKLVLYESDIFWLRRFQITKQSN